MQLRDYQIDIKNGLYRSWSEGNRNVALVSPTGSGKTVIMGSIAKDQTLPGCAIAHRTELVGQISMTMARMGIVHNIIAASATIRFCISQHIRELGCKFYNPDAYVTVAAVDTLNARANKLKQWAVRQRWWMVDECHHLLVKNKWGKATEMFPNAHGVGVTATPVRADRKSLHVKQGGLFNDMVIGPSMRDLINRGSLCDYRIWAPPQSFLTDNLPIASSGDYSRPSLRKASRESQIIGDVVKHYKTLASGLRGITFTVDVETAIQTAKAYNEAGVPAMAVSAKTPDMVRAEAVRKLKSGKLLQLVNVDLFGEGFDVPAVEVVSMARPTMSYGLYVQQFGRALRPIDGKTHGIIIDHVGNVKKHGLPDAPREWTLFNEEYGKRSKTDDKITPVTSCPECFAAYEALTPVCPFCGHKPEPVSRSGPEFVEGDLIEIDPSVLEQMRKEVDRIDGDPIIPHNATPVIEASVKKRWIERQEAQVNLRHNISIWAGVWRDKGADDHEIYRRFYHRFSIDIMSAQSLSAAGAKELSLKIMENWNADK